MTMPLWLGILLIVITLVLGAGASYFMFQKGKQKTVEEFEKLGQTAKGIIADAEKEGAKRQKELVSEAKAEIANLKNEFNEEVKEKKKEMAEEMKRIGFDYLQGYYYSQPIPADEFVRKYAK